MYNKAIHYGRLTRDPELRYSAQGNPYTKFTVASDVHYQTSSEAQKKTCFADWVFFGRRAEVICQHFRKRHRILVEGQCVTNEWEDKVTGQKRTKNEFIGQTFSFGESKNREKEGESSLTHSPSPSYSPPRQPSQHAHAPDSYPDYDDSDIPF